MLLLAQGGVDATTHEIVRTAIFGGVGVLVTIIGFFVRAMANDVRTTVEKLGKHDTALATLDQRVTSAEKEVGALRDWRQDLNDSAAAELVLLAQRRKVGGE